MIDETGIVGDHGNGHTRFGEAGGAPHFRRLRERGGYQNIADASGRHRFRLADGRNANTVGSGCQLQFRDARTFVRLGVRAHVDAALGSNGCGGFNVAPKGGAIEHEAWCRQLGPATGLPDQVCVGTEGVTGLIVGVH